MEMDGTKYDQGKPRLAEMIKDFAIPMKELCRVWEFGANKYSKSNWKKVDDGYTRYTNALVRHLLQEEECAVDEETHILHAAHIAFNSLARLYFLLIEDKKIARLD